MKQADRASTHRCGIRSRARLRSLPISPRIWSESATLRARSTRHGIDAERLPASFAIGGWVGTSLFVNTNTGAYLPGGTSGEPLFGVEDAGDYWRCWVTRTATSAHPNEYVYLYPAYGPANNLTTFDVSLTGSVTCRRLMLTETASPTTYVATGSVAVNEGAPRGLAA